MDWLTTFYPAVQALLRGDSFYIFNAPWALFPLIPFVAFPWGRELLLVASLCAMAFTAYRLGASPVGVAVFLLSPFVFDALLWGNVEWLAILGFAINPALGLVLMAVKPQITVAVMAFLVVESWRSHGWRDTLKLAAPLVAVVIASFAIFGLWPLNMVGYTAVIDLSFFPWSVPIGAALFVQSLRTHNIRYAVAASPMFAPTLTPQCWLVVFLALVPSIPKLSFASLSAWGYFIANKVFAA